MYLKYYLKASKGILLDFGGPGLVKESEFDAAKIKEFDAMKDDITNIKGTMAAILDHLKKQK